MGQVQCFDFREPRLIQHLFLQLLIRVRGHELSCWHRSSRWSSSKPMYSTSQIDLQGGTCQTRTWIRHRRRHLLGFCPMDDIRGTADHRPLSGVCHSHPRHSLYRKQGVPMTPKRVLLGVVSPAWMSISDARLPKKAAPTCLMKSEASHRIGPSLPTQDAKAAAPSRQRRAVFRPIAIWHPRRDARAVRRRKVSGA